MRSFKTAGGLALAGLCLALAGCVNAPMTSYFEATAQPKIGAAGHWDAVANDVVAKTLETLQKTGIERTTPVHVALPAEPSQFDKGFRELIITKLVQSGVTVMQQPTQAQLQISYGAQVVRHGKRLPNPELVLTTTVVRNNQYLARKTDVYYLEKSDAVLFTAEDERPEFPVKNLKVVGQ